MRCYLCVCLCYSFLLYFDGCLAVTSCLCDADSSSEILQTLPSGVQWGKKQIIHYTQDFSYSLLRASHLNFQAFFSPLVFRKDFASLLHLITRKIEVDIHFKKSKQMALLFKTKSSQLSSLLRGFLLL